MAKVEKEYGRYIKDYTGRAEEAAAHAARGLRRPLQGDARHAGHHPHPRPAAPRVPAQARGPDGPGGDAARAGREEEQAKIAKLSETLRAVEELHEFNPMLGHRGCRLGITYPELTRMQARAIFEAAAQVAKKGTPVKPEVMIPLVGHVEELRRQKKIVLDTAEGGAGRQPVRRRVPGRHHDRGPARRPHRRRDREGGRLLLLRHQRPHPDGLRAQPRRRRQVPRLLPGARDPGEGPVRLHRRGRGGPARRDRREEGPAGEAVAEDRRVRRARRRSVVDPLLPRGGLDYVSCSPYRVPIARLAAAQAQLEKPVGD